MRGRDKFNKIKPIITLLSKILRLLPISFRNLLFIKFRMCKGNIGIVIRYIILKSIVYDCGDNISIHPGVYLLNIKNIKIGNNVSIHPMCYIDSAGGIIIGNDVSIAHSTTIMSTEHIYDSLNINIKDQGVVCKKTVINDNVWIGSGVRVLAGNEVKFGSVLAAGSVVTKDVEENVIVAGVPAKIIKYRNKN